MSETDRRIKKWASEVTKWLVIDELIRLSDRDPFYYSALNPVQRKLADEQRRIVLDRLFDIEIRQYRDMWE